MESCRCQNFSFYSIMQLVPTKKVEWLTCNKKDYKMNDLILNIGGGILKAPPANPRT